MAFFRINAFSKRLIPLVISSSISLFNLNKVSYNEGIDKDNLNKDILDQDCKKSKREIYIFGEINDQIAKKTIKKIKSLNEDNSLPIRIIINSPGGGIIDSYAIIDEIKNSKSIIETVCQGGCMSSAALILMSGNTGSRFATENSIILIHPIRRYFSNGEQEIVESKYYSDPEKKRSQILNTIFLKIIKNNTKLKEEEVKMCCQKDVFFTANEAKERNIVDQVF